jgi:hypothetical protein
VADARVLKINFVDHVIVGQAMAVGLGYFSFEERVLASDHLKRKVPAFLHGIWP